MYQRIVVGTDGSATARAALAQAADMATGCGASLHVVHGAGTATVFGDSVMAVPGPVTDRHLTAIEHDLETQVAPLRDQGVEVTVHVLAESGSDAVLTVAEQVDADLVVVGSQGMAGKRRFILGSVPNSVSHHAPCSVLIVHTG